MFSFLKKPDGQTHEREGHTPAHGHAGGCCGGHAHGHGEQEQRDTPGVPVANHDEPGTGRDAATAGNSHPTHV